MTAIDHGGVVSDIELIDLARAGQSEALAALWERHYAGAVRTARRWTSNAYDAEDVASEAFSRMLAAVGEGKGPTGSVGGYLAISVRNLVVNRAKRHESSNLRTPEPELYASPQSTHADPVAERVELGLVREAFSALPTRWRIVLWRTAVDRDTNRTLAEEMGMTANAVAALAVRARAGFRAAYLQAHVSRGAVDPACQPFIVLLPPMVSGGKPSAALGQHLDGCDRCRDRAAELLEVERHLGALIFPAVLVAGWAKLSGTVSGGRIHAFRPRGLLLAGASGLGAVALVGAAIAGPESAPAQVMAAQEPAVTAPAVPSNTPSPPPSDPPVEVPAAAPPLVEAPEQVLPTTPSPAPPVVATPTTLPSPSISPSATPTQAAPFTPTPTPTPTVELSPTPTQTVELSPMPTPTVELSPTPTPTVELSPTPTPTPTWWWCHPNEGMYPHGCHRPFAPEGELAPSPAPAPDPSPTPEPDPSPAPAPDPSPAPAPDPSPTPEPVPSTAPAPDSSTDPAPTS